MFKWIGIGLGVIILLLISFIVGLAIAPVGVREAFRDIFIIILGCFMLISSLLTITILLSLLYMINRVERLASGNLVPKLDQAMVKLNEVLDSTRVLAEQARQSAGTVTNSTTFVAEQVVSPVIRIASLASGVRAAATTLARRNAHEDAEKSVAP